MEMLLAEKMVENILADLTDRKGFRQAWDLVDKEIQNEIRAAWKDIIYDTYQESL